MLFGSAADLRKILVAACIGLLRWVAGFAASLSPFSPSTTDQTLLPLVEEAGDSAAYRAELPDRLPNLSRVTDHSCSSYIVNGVAKPGAASGGGHDLDTVQAIVLQNGPEAGRAAFTDSA